MELDWHKSSYSGSNGGDCLEVAEAPSAVYVRDTQNRELGHLAFDPEAFAAFVQEVKAGRL
ncbi:uncharacterized protein DUF397 [Murinocardiopsis flavida]|uniref:Uncharacterized protein DUF397 n=1 Tax=Murinocardiopsis flavida TaxID=645275 RepID=A0A2P8D130_9ACTN|nr:DUF397 domain-containing protein [Murinocardiopsis flavida]PSK90922.1 uncharacterized protein DUF397 [Murinocardiopsis flavida]